MRLSVVAEDEMLMIVSTASRLGRAKCHHLESGDDLGRACELIGLQPQALVYTLTFADIKKITFEDDLWRRMTGP